MAGKDLIVISDSDSDTLSESERPVYQRSTKAKAAVTSNVKPRQEVAGSSKQAEAASATTTTPAAGPSAPGLLGLIPNRRQLEEERKERARKRRREQNLPSDSDDDETQVETKRGKTGNTLPASQLGSSSAPVESFKSRLASNPSSSNSAPFLVFSNASSSYSSATDPIAPTSRFWSGTVKHGYNMYADKSVSGVSISQMLLPATLSSRNGLQFAVLATYDLRIEWLYSLFPRGLPVTLVLPPPKEDYRTDPAIARPGLHPSEIFGAEFARCPGWQICVPHKPKGGWLTQHMKFLILIHQDFLRVAILSGNLNGIDWERIENTAFIQDFPRVSAAGSSGSTSANNDFKSQLVRVLRSLSLPSSHAIYAALDGFDFSQATRARIVASWPEASSLAEWDRIETQGLGRLGKVVRDMEIREAVEIECQGSSLTNHDVKWIEHFHMLASGVNPRGKLPLKGKANEVHAEYVRAMGRKLGELPPVKICFPSHRYVEERTVEGPMGALSFFGKAETFNDSSPQSRRGDVMIHAKSILALTSEGIPLVSQAFLDAFDPYISGRSTRPAPSTTAWAPNPNERPIGWTYLGSSNFTRAAHGNMAGSIAKPTMSSMNWELGVVMPIYASEVELFGVQAESLRAVVYHRPVQGYARDDSPWVGCAQRGCR